MAPLAEGAHPTEHFPRVRVEQEEEEEDKTMTHMRGGRNGPIAGPAGAGPGWRGRPSAPAAPPPQRSPRPRPPTGTSRAGASGPLMIFWLRKTPNTCLPMDSFFIQTVACISAAERLIVFMHQLYLRKHSDNGFQIIAEKYIFILGLY